MTRTHQRPRQEDQAVREGKIYRTYRAALRSVNATGRRRPKAATRRLRARRMTLARHDVSCEELVRIVAEHDQRAGVTHEHDPMYLLHQQLQAATAAFVADPRPCPQCGGDVLVRPRFDYDPPQRLTGRYTLGCLPCAALGRLPLRDIPRPRSS